MNFLSTFFVLLLSWLSMIPALLWYIVSSKLFISGIFIVLFCGANYLALEHIDAQIYAHEYYEAEHDAREIRWHYLKCTGRWFLGFTLHGAFFAAIGALWDWATYTDEHWVPTVDFGASVWLWLVPMCLAFYVVHAYRDALRKDTVWSLWPTTAR